MTSNQNLSERFRPYKERIQAANEAWEAQTSLTISDKNSNTSIARIQQRIGYTDEIQRQGRNRNAIPIFFEILDLEYLRALIENAPESKYKQTLIERFDQATQLLKQRRAHDTKLTSGD